MTILLQGSTDARKLGIRSIKRVYHKIKNKNKPDSNIKKDSCKQVQVNSKKIIFRVLELLHKKCKFNKQPGV